MKTARILRAAALVIFLALGACRPGPWPEEPPPPDPTSCLKCQEQGGYHVGCRHGEPGQRCECMENCDCDH